MAYVLKLLASVGLSAAFGASASVVEPRTAVILEDGDCRSSCTARPSDGAPFSLSFGSYEKGYDMFIDLQIGDRKFKNLPISRRFIADGSLPFFQHTFPQHTLYGLRSSRSTKNTYAHYFIRSGGGFSHLGRFPYLSYDTQLGLFVGFIFFTTGATRYYYRLQGDRLVEEEDF